MASTDKRPSFQFYPSDFITDPNVAAMDCAEVGAYIRLLSYCWIQGGVLKRDERVLARLSGAHPAEWKRIRESVLSCFVLDGDCYRHKRLDLERRKQDAYKKQQSEAGKIGMAKRYHRYNDPITEPLTEPLTESKSSSSSSSSSSSTTGIPNRGFAPKGTPDGVAIPGAPAPAAPVDVIIPALVDPEPTDQGALIPLTPRQKPEASPADLFAAWNRLTTAPIPQATELTKGRSAKARTRLREHPLQWWESVIARIEASQFCHGKSERGWIPTIDWLLANDTNCLKVLEGKYDDRVPSYGDHIRTRTSGNQDAARQALALMGIEE